MMRKFVSKTLVFVIKYWLPFMVWVMLIYSFSSNPTVKTSEIHWQDFIVKKSAHIVEYFIYSLLLYRALINSRVSSYKALFYIVLAAFLYGAIDEFHQSFTPGREPRLRDVLIDTTGAILFVYSLKNIILRNKKLLYVAKMIQLVD